MQVTDRGFIQTDFQRRTEEPSIFAIGDVAGEPMLAHKASHEARVAVEAIAGHKAIFEPLAIPAVVYRLRCSTDTKPSRTACAMSATVTSP